MITKKKSVIHLNAKKLFGYLFTLFLFADQTKVHNFELLMMTMKINFEIS